MKILFIVPNPPSLVRVRPYNLVRYLAERDHDVTLATLWSTPEEERDIDSLRSAGFAVIAAPLGKRQILRNLVNATITGEPLQARFCDTPELRSRLKEVLNGQHRAHSRPFDVVHVEHLRGAQYGLFVQELPRLYRLPIVWDSVDCISYLFQQTAMRSRSRRGRLMAQLDLGRTQRYEGWLVNQFDRVVVTSGADKRALDALAAAQEQHGRRPTPVRVLPNGVDLDYFSFQESGRNPATILFSGKMSYHANVTAATYLLEEVMPQIWCHRPDAKVVIAGKDPPPALRRLAETLPRVRVTGTVPDLRPYLHTATVAVSPILYGAGIQNKVLEALACGAPVVASTQAAAALQVIPGLHLLLAESTAVFVQHLLGLLSDPEQQRSLSRQGRAYVEAHHSWEQITADLDHHYHELVEEHRKKKQNHTGSNSVPSTMDLE